MRGRQRFELAESMGVGYFKIQIARGNIRSFRARQLELHMGLMPEGTTADYHTHPPRIPFVQQPDDFSSGVDIPNPYSNDRSRGYLGTPPNGDTKVFTPPNVRTPRPECTCKEASQP